VQGGLGELLLTKMLGLYDGFGFATGRHFCGDSAPRRPHGADLGIPGSCFRGGKARASALKSLAKCRCSSLLRLNLTLQATTSPPAASDVHVEVGGLTTRLVCLGFFEISSGNKGLNLAVLLIFDFLMASQIVLLRLQL